MRRLDTLDDWHGPIQGGETAAAGRYFNGLLVDANYGKRATTELAEIESPEWVGRQLRQSYMQVGAQQVRFSMHGKYLRGYRIHEEFIGKMAAKAAEISALDELGRTDDPRAFCNGCKTCAYRAHCEMRAVREEKDGNGPSTRATSSASRRH